MEVAEFGSMCFLCIVALPFASDVASFEGFGVADLVWNIS
jgi:hypothetical protein